MCGIIGYCSSDGKAAPAIYRGLQKMEYRGYDSSGVAIISGGRLRIRKAAGKLEDVNKKCHLDSIPGAVGIGHNRWATHGGVTDSNAHPHTDCSGEIAVIHNGIIDNYQELRDGLLKKGHKFSSETDTEVISHLLEDEMQKGRTLLAAMQKVSGRLQGSFAFLAVCAREPDHIIATRNSSPLIMGMGDQFTMAASDALAFDGQSAKVVGLGENEIALLTPSSIRFYDYKGKELRKKFSRVSSTWNDAGRGKYDHYMLKEIMEQPGALADAAKQDKDTFARVALDILRADKVVVTACGSSRYAALVGRYLFSSVGKKFCEVVMASEFQYFADSMDKNTLVLAISQSGETYDVIEGVKLARAAGARVVSVINRPQTLLAGLSDHVIYLNCGPEIGVVATKSFLNQMAVFYLLAFSMVHAYDKACADLIQLGRQVEKTIKWNSEVIDAVARSFNDRNDFYYIARGINFAIASEGALKLKEISYSHAEGMPAGELKHGTLSLIEKGTPVVVICPDDFTYRETLSNAIEARSRGASLIAVSDRNNEVYDHWIRIPKVHELLYPFVAVIPLQLLAYHHTIRRGLDPDRPRNLAKSVTVQ